MAEQIASSNASNKEDRIHLLIAKLKLGGAGIVLLISLAWMVASWMSDSGDGGWFARSGSIPTVSIAVTTFWLDGFRKLFEGDGMGDYYWQELFKKLKPWFMTLQASALFMLCISTIVWAYGDLVYKHFHN